MAGFDKPIDEINRPRDEGVLVPRVEADKKGKESFANLPIPTKNILNAAILFYFKSLLDSYHLQAGPEETDFSKNLIAFRNLLQLLGTKDQSKQPHFTQQLAKVWHKMKQDFNFIKFFGEKAPAVILKVKNIFTEISQHPLGQEHTLGYYLEKHAGEEWLPFPYIEILSTLHKEYQRKPHESHLSKWILQLDQIIHLLKKE